jgi:hypothetical protein
MSVCWAVVHAQETKQLEPRRLISTKTIQLEGRSIQYQRIQAPERMQPTPVARRSADRPVTTPSSRLLRLPKLLSLSATVHDREMTDVRWLHDGKTYRVWSSIDFNFLRGIGQFTTETDNYMVFLGVANQSRPLTRARNASLAASGLPAQPDVLAQFKAIKPPATGGSWYVVVSAPEDGATELALKGLDDLHRHYDANRERLQQEYQEAEERRIAREEWHRLHPPVPQDSVIRFWPKQSKRYMQEVAR